MRLKINSCKVPAFYLRIFSGDQEVYSGLMYSQSTTEIDIDHPDGQSLKLEWRFILSSEEKHTLRNMTNCPPWEIYAKEPPTLTTGFDRLFLKRNPNPAGEAYGMQINAIPADLDEICLNFRGSRFYSGYALLDVADAQLDQILDISFYRKTDIDKVQKEGQAYKGKYLRYRYFELLFLFIIGCIIESCFPNLVLIILIVSLFWKEIHGMQKMKKELQGLLEKIKEIAVFKETENGVESLDK